METQDARRLMSRGLPGAMPGTPAVLELPSLEDKLQALEQHRQLRQMRCQSFFHQMTSLLPFDAAPDSLTLLDRRRAAPRGTGAGAGAGAGTPPVARRASETGCHLQQMAPAEAEGTAREDSQWCERKATNPSVHSQRDRVLATLSSGDHPYVLPLPPCPQQPGTRHLARVRASASLNERMGEALDSFQGGAAPAPKERQPSPWHNAASSTTQVPLLSPRPDLSASPSTSPTHCPSSLLLPPSPPYYQAPLLPPYSQSRTPPAMKTGSSRKPKAGTLSADQVLMGSAGSGFAREQAESRRWDVESARSSWPAGDDGPPHGAGGASGAYASAAALAVEGRGDGATPHSLMVAGFKAARERRRDLHSRQASSAPQSEAWPCSGASASASASQAATAAQGLNGSAITGQGGRQLPPGRHSEPNRVRRRSSKGSSGGGASAERNSDCRQLSPEPFFASGPGASLIPSRAESKSPEQSSSARLPSLPKRVPGSGCRLPHDEMYLGTGDGTDDESSSSPSLRGNLLFLEFDVPGHGSNGSFSGLSEGGDESDVSHCSAKAEASRLRTCIERKFPRSVTSGRSLNEESPGLQRGGGHWLSDEDRPAHGRHGGAVLGPVSVNSREIFDRIGDVKQQETDVTGVSSDANKSLAAAAGAVAAAAAGEAAASSPPPPPPHEGGGGMADVHLLLSSCIGDFASSRAQAMRASRGLQSGPKEMQAASSTAQGTGHKESIPQYASTALKPQLPVIFSDYDPSDVCTSSASECEPEPTRSRARVASAPIVLLNRKPSWGETSAGNALQPTQQQTGCSLGILAVTAVSSGVLLPAHIPSLAQTTVSRKGHSSSPTFSDCSVSDVCTSSASECEDNLRKANTRGTKMLPHQSLARVTKNSRQLSGLPTDQGHSALAPVLNAAQLILARKLRPGPRIQPSPVAVFSDYGASDYATSSASESESSLRSAAPLKQTARRQTGLQAVTSSH